MISNIPYNFGNDWGLYVDIENLNGNYINNEEILRDKYTIPNYKKTKYYDYVINDFMINEYNTTYEDDIYKEYNENTYNDYIESIYDEYKYYTKDKISYNDLNKPNNTNSIKYFTRLSSSIFITATITFIVFFVI